MPRYDESAKDRYVRRLYQERFKSWEEFCKAELHQSPGQANREIKGASLAIELERAGCRPLPTCERHVRALGLLRLPSLRIQAWNDATAMKRPGFSPSEADVRRAVRRLMRVPPPVDIASLRKIKKELARSHKSLKTALVICKEPEVNEALVGPASLKQRLLIGKLVQRNRELIDRFNVETKILL